MTLHSQKMFNVRNEDKGRSNHVTVPQVAHTFNNDQDELALKWQELRKLEISGKEPHRVGARSVWARYSVLFAKHGELTVGDLVTMLGKDKSVVRANLNGWANQGLVEKEIVQGVRVYRLVQS